MRLVIVKPSFTCYLCSSFAEMKRFADTVARLIFLVFAPKINLLERIFQKVFCIYRRQTFGKITPLTLPYDQLVIYILATLCAIFMALVYGSHSGLK